MIENTNQAHELAMLYMQLHGEDAEPSERELIIFAQKYSKLAEGMRKALHQK